MARTATSSKPATLDELTELLGGDARLVDSHGRQVILSSEIVVAFQGAIAELRSPGSDDLTTQESAKLLGVSRPTLIRLLDTGVLPFRRTQGERGHRRIRRRDALAYLHADLERRRRALDELAADADAFGFFEA